MYLTDDAAEATRLLDAVIAECDAEDIPELATLATTLRRWRTEILAHLVLGIIALVVSGSITRRRAGGAFGQVDVVAVI